MNPFVATARVVDNHCHGLRTEARLQLDPARLEERLTYMGMVYDAAAGGGSPVDPRETSMVRVLAGSSVFAMAARRALAGFLGCAESPAAVAEARAQACGADPGGYVRSLLADQNVAALIADEGYPDVSRQAFEVEVGVPVYRAWRIAKDDVERLQRNLVVSCCTGVGDPFPVEVVRAMLLLRANSLVIGRSGMRPPAD